MALNLQITTITVSSYTIVSSNTVLLVNVAGPVSIKLPTGSGGDDQRSYFIKDISGNATTNPKDSRFFNFDYEENEIKFGNVTASLIDKQNLKI